MIPGGAAHTIDSDDRQIIVFLTDQSQAIGAHITECGFIKYAEKYHVMGMLPAICQVDYMIAHYMHVGFGRTQTLGAGCACCDGCYAMHGECSWNIEQ